MSHQCRPGDTCDRCDGLDDRATQMQRAHHALDMALKYNAEGEEDLEYAAMCRALFQLVELATPHHKLVAELRYVCHNQLPPTRSDERVAREWAAYYAGHGRKPEVVS